MKIIGKLAYWYSLLVYKTCRWEKEGIKKVHDVINVEKSIVVIGWHGRMFLTPCPVMRAPKNIKKGFEIEALVSPHQDGLIITNYLNGYKVKSISGSSNRDAQAAALKLMNCLKDGKSVFIVPDGPVGPNMNMTMSPVYFAQKTQKPIYFITYSIHKAKILQKAWDNMMIPKPFAKAAYDLAGPFYVPQDATAEELEKYRLEIETKVNKTLLNLDKRMEVLPVEIGKVARKKKLKEG
ncbi:MAG: lysophospholipid acyltransferase family protein [Alphaproteobacteria bacterium]